MKTNIENSTAAERLPARSRARLLRIVVPFLACACLVALVAALWPHRAQNSNNNPPQLADHGSPTAPPSTVPRQDGTRRDATSRPASPARPVYEQPEPTPGMRQLVNSLVEGGRGPLTEEQALAWKTNLQSLIQQGAQAVPALSEFLTKNTDFTFDPNERNQLGYPSLRSAMLDALAQIGGPVAVNAMAQVLQTAADPREIAFLGQNLEKLDPGVHRQEVFDAAREALGMAADGKLPDRDVAPLFEVLQQFGGAGAIGDLESSAKQWNYYAMIALAGLPDQAGIPSLARIAATPEGVNPAARMAALDMLAVAVPQSEDARAALLDLVHQNQLSASQWAALTPMLAGNQMVFHNSAFENVLATVSPSDVKSMNIPASNQVIATAPLGAMTTDQIDLRKAFLDQLLAVTSDPTAVQALQRAKDLLAQRLFQIAATAGK